MALPLTKRPLIKSAKPTAKSKGYLAGAKAGGRAPHAAARLPCGKCVDHMAWNGLFCFTIALRIINNLRAQAMTHCFGDLPLALNLAAKVRIWGQWRMADRAAI